MQMMDSTGSGMKLWLLILLVLGISCARGDGSADDARHAKFLKFNGNADLDRLNFDRIIWQWNRSTADDEVRNFMIRSPDRGVETTTVGAEPSAEEQPPPTDPEENVRVTDIHSLVDELSRAFKACIFRRKKEIVRSSSRGKNIIFKCFKTELLKQLRDVVGESDSISLLNGYVELEKIDKPRKRWLKKFDGNKQTETSKESNGNFENFEKTFDELFVENGRSKRLKRITYGNETVEDGTIFSRSGKELIDEIANSLEHEEEEERSLKDSVMDGDFLSTLSELSRKFAVRFNLFPGVSARMKRGKSSGVTFDLELDDLTGFGDDDDDDDDDSNKKKKKKRRKNTKDDSSEEDEEDEDAEDATENEAEKDAEAEDAEEEEQDDGLRKGKGKGGKGGKKGGGSAKKKMKALKKLVPYLLIPMMIQAVMLPIALKMLLFFAIKALLAGKIALLLVAINLIKNTDFRSDEDEYIERISYDHYGYGKGEEYGAWINRRALRIAEDDPATYENDPYGAYAPVRR